MSKTIKRVFSLLLCVLLLFSVAPIMATYAEDNPTGSCGINATWVYDTATATLTISGTGAMNNYSTTKSYINSSYITITTAPWGTYYNKMKTVVINSGITSIGQSAFYHCISIRSVTIPDSVREIGTSAFCDCNNLLSVSIPDHVKSIGDHAFRDCTGLTRVNISDSVTSIGDYAFLDDLRLAELSIGNGVISIGEQAFANCQSLTSVTIPDSVTRMGQSVFLHCTELVSATISQNISMISPSTFRDCTALESVNIPDKVTVIGYYAFMDCKYLTSITIPESIEIVGEKAFSGCTGLAELNFHAENAAVSSSSNVFSNAGTLTGGMTVVFGDTVEKIPANLFYTSSSDNKPNVKTVTISKSVTEIENRAFAECSSITDVYYTGTQEQWDAITISLPNDGLLNATLHVHEHTPKVVTVPATCLEDGKEYTACDVCGEKLSEDTILPARGHDFGDWIETKAPTCTESGTETKYCSRCEETASRSIAATGHHYNDGVVTQKPTCTETGIRTFTCACGDSYTEPVEKTDHTPGEWETVKEPTESETGKAVRKCTECGEPMGEKVLPKLERLKSVALKDVSIDCKASAALKPEINATAGIKATIAYESSNPNIVTVDNNGNVKGLKKGTATITCTVTDQYGNTVKDTCKVTVNYTAWQWVIVILLFGWIWY